MSRDARLMLTVAGAVIFGFFLGGTTVNAVRPEVIQPTITKCVFEDGSMPGQKLPCLWDGTKRGNKQGKSFIVNQDTTITYL